MSRRGSIQQGDSRRGSNDTGAQERRSSIQKSNSRRASNDLGIPNIRRGSVDGIPLIQFLMCEKCKRNVLPQESVEGPLSKPYHSYCLTCNRCGKLLTSDTMDVYQNKPMCESCFLKT